MRQMYNYLTKDEGRNTDFLLTRIQLNYRTTPQRELREDLAKEDVRQTG